MFGLGTWEIAIIVAAGLLILGPTALPKLGRSLGKTLREFRSASSHIKDEFEKGYTEKKPKGGKKS